MASKEAQSAVDFQSDNQNVEFQPEQGLGAESMTGRLAEAAQTVDWNKVGIGVGAAAAVAGAAYAAKKFIGRDAEESGGGKSTRGTKRGR